MDLIYDTKERRVAALQQAIKDKESWNNIYRYAKDRSPISSPSFNYYSDSYQRTSFEINELKMKLNILQNPNLGRQ